MWDTGLTGTYLPAEVALITDVPSTPRRLRRLGAVDKSAAERLEMWSVERGTLAWCDLDDRTRPRVLRLAEECAEAVAWTTWSELSAGSPVVEVALTGSCVWRGRADGVLDVIIVVEDMSAVVRHLGVVDVRWRSAQQRTAEATLVSLGALVRPDGTPGRYDGFVLESGRAYDIDLRMSRIADGVGTNLVNAVPIAGDVVSLSVSSRDICRFAYGLFQEASLLMAAHEDLPKCASRIIEVEAMLNTITPIDSEPRPSFNGIENYAWPDLRPIYEYSLDRVLHAIDLFYGRAATNGLSVGHI